MRLVLVVTVQYTMWVAKNWTGISHEKNSNFEQIVRGYIQIWYLVKEKLAQYPRLLAHNHPAPVLFSSFKSKGWFLNIIIHTKLWFLCVSRNQLQ